MTETPPRLLLVNGPNLGRLGTRRPAVYGPATLSEITAAVEGIATAAGWRLTAFQSNHEGAIIDFLDSHRAAAGAIINPGALMMAGWSLRDALEDFPAPWIEVHLSNIWRRESFRHQSVLCGLAVGVIAGLGAAGYRLAAQALIERGAAP